MGSLSVQKNPPFQEGRSSAAAAAAGAARSPDDSEGDAPPCLSPQTARVEVSTVVIDWGGGGFGKYHKAGGYGRED